MDKRIKSFECLLVGMVFLVSSCAHDRVRPTPALPVSFQFDGSQLTIRTERYEITWRDGCAVSLTTLLPARKTLTVNGALDQFDLPNGIGSYADTGPKTVETLHIGRRGSTLGSEKGMSAALLQSFHPVPTAPRIHFERTDGGAQLTYSGLSGDPTAVLIQEFSVDPATGDLRIRQTGKSEKPGIYGTAFSLLNLRRDIEFIVPYFEGQKISPSNAFWGVGFGHFWQFGLVVAEMPDGGSFFFFADDPELGGKYLRILDSEAGNARALNLESIADPPFENITQFSSITWRFNTFAGGWHDPARRYKQWLTETYQVQPIRERPVSWPEDTALVIPNVNSCDPRKLAAALGRPETMLFHIYNWADGFNRYAPYYRPRPKMNMEALKVQMDEIGAKWGLYYSLGIIDVNAHPNIFRDYNLLIAKDYMRTEVIARCLALQDELLHGDLAAFQADKGRNLQYIHPGNQPWRDLYAKIMAKEVEKYQMSLQYQDVCGLATVCPRVEGLTYGQGMVAGTKQIRAACPDQAQSAEFRTEVSFAAGYDFGATDFGIWFGDWHHQALGQNAHPMMGFIIDDFIKYFNFADTHQRSPAFHWSMNAAEVVGFLPTWIGGAKEAFTGNARLNLKRAQLFAEGFRPHFPDAYEQDVAGYLRHPDGRLVKYLRSGDSSFCYLFEEGVQRLLYGRVHGVETVALGESVQIDGWLAHRDGAPIGLNPEEWYAVFPGAGPATPFEVTSIPQGLFITRSLLFPDKTALVVFGGEGQGPVQWRSAEGETTTPIETGDSILFEDGEPLDLEVNGIIPADAWNWTGIRNGLVLGEVAGTVYPNGLQQLERQPVALLQAPPGGPGSENCLYRLVTLPRAEALMLSGEFFKYSCPGDGMNIHLYVNGQKAWSEELPPQDSALRSFSVPLTEHAGTSVMLMISVDCKGAINTSGDIVYLGNLVLQEPAVNSPGIETTETTEESEESKQ